MAPLRRHAVTRPVTVTDTPHGPTVIGPWHQAGVVREAILLPQPDGRGDLYGADIDEADQPDDTGAEAVVWIPARLQLRRPRALAGFPTCACSPLGGAAQVLQFGAEQRPQIQNLLVQCRGHGGRGVGVEEMRESSSCDRADFFMQCGEGIVVADGFHIRHALGGRGRGMSRGCRVPVCHGTERDTERPRARAGAPAGE